MLVREYDYNNKNYREQDYTMIKYSRRHHRRKRQRGRGILDFLAPVGNFFKNSRIISSVASMIPNPIAQTIGVGANMLGLGRPRVQYVRGRPRIRTDYVRGTSITSLHSKIQKVITL